MLYALKSEVCVRIDLLVVPLDTVRSSVWGEVRVILPSYIPLLLVSDSTLLKWCLE